MLKLLLQNLRVVILLSGNKKNIIFIVLISTNILLKLRIGDSSMLLLFNEGWGPVPMRDS